MPFVCDALGSPVQHMTQQLRRWCLLLWLNQLLLFSPSYFSLSPPISVKVVRFNAKPCCKSSLIYSWCPLQCREGQSENHLVEQVGQTECFFVPFNFKFKTLKTSYFFILWLFLVLLDVFAQNIQWFSISEDCLAGCRESHGQSSGI